MTSPEIRAHRRRLAIPFALAVVLLGGYTIVWFYGAGVMRAEIAEWIARERAAGRSVEHGTIRVRGFPGSLRAEIEAPRWADAGDWAWRADQLLVLTSPFEPDRVILTPRGGQTVSYRGEPFDLAASDLRVGLEAERVAVEGQDVLASGAGWDLSLAAMRMNWDGAEGGPVLGVSFGRAALAGPRGESYWVPQLNAALSSLEDEGVGLEAFEGALGPARGEPVSVFTGRGRVAVGADGYPQGRLDVTLADPQPLAAVLLNAGAIDQDQAGSAVAFLGGMAGEDGVAELPFVFRDGRLRFGPLPVADLPRF